MIFAQSAGARANPRLRLLLRFAEGPMSEAASLPSSTGAIAKAVAVRLQVLHAARLTLASRSVRP
ncbi:MAG: hypothetical protein ACM3PU_11010 [Gemmatimonadota bacterium]